MSARVLAQRLLRDDPIQRSNPQVLVAVPSSVHRGAPNRQLLKPLKMHRRTKRTRPQRHPPRANQRRGGPSYQFARSSSGAQACVLMQRRVQK